MDWRGVLAAAGAGSLAAPLDDVVAGAAAGRTAGREARGGTQARCRVTREC